MPKLQFLTNLMCKCGGWGGLDAGGVGEGGLGIGAGEGWDSSS